jgi:allantoin racemase
MPLDIALLNANTTVAMTDRMVARAAARLGPRATVRGLTAPFGAPYISDRAASAAAAHAVAEMTAALRADPPDVAIIACFGDPGLWAARELVAFPVAGMAEASMLTACQMGRRFGIVTGGPAWKPMLEEFAAACGLASRLAGVRALPITGAEIAADPAAATGRLIDAARAGVAEDGADVIILGGAALVGLRDVVAAAIAAPVVDSLDCALAQAEALAGLAACSR